MAENGRFRSDTEIGSTRAPSPTKPLGIADKALRNAARLWFLVALIGQWTFVVYILGFYGRAAARGDFDKWGKFLTHGFIHGDSVGNLALATHISLAAVITALGPLQLIPQVRARCPSFHRWSGRLYLLTALAASVAALYMLWIRNERVPGDLAQHLGISLDALLIMICGAMSLRFALKREFAAHRRWAIRLFLVVSGVWFFRVGLFLWLIINQGPVGFDVDKFQGPFLDFLSTADSVIPLIIFELYLRAQHRKSSAVRLAAAGGLGVATIATAIGIFGVFTNIWLPNI